MLGFLRSGHILSLLKNYVKLGHTKCACTYLTSSFSSSVGSERSVGFNRLTIEYFLQYLIKALIDLLIHILWRRVDSRLAWEIPHRFRVLRLLSCSTVPVETPIIVGDAFNVEVTFFNVVKQESLSILISEIVTCVLIISGIQGTGNKSDGYQVNKN